MAKKSEIQISEVPPSVNAMYRYSKFGMYITKKGREFKDYIEDTLGRLAIEGKIELFGDARLKVQYEFHFKGKRKRDTDNYIKSLQDCLEGIIFDNDEQIDELTAKRTYHNDENLTIIKIEEIH